MTFQEVLNDIKKLVGLELQSVRPGANITITEVDEERSCVLLKTAQGIVRSRPISELQTIWDELTRNAAIHVEGVLHGSGTSRNQPETIFANLPYVEWLKINNKKHLTYVGSNTHPFGTLKQMNGMAAAELSAKMSAKDQRECIAVIVTTDLSACVSQLQQIHAGTIAVVEQGLYKYETTAGYYFIVGEYATTLSVGTYLVVPSKNIPYHTGVDIGGEYFWKIDENGLKVLISKI